jgi:hypothetical protein
MEKLVIIAKYLLKLQKLENEAFNLNENKW